MKKKVRTYSGTTNPEVSLRERKNRAVARRAAAEGIVLLKNENHLLPLEKNRRIALFGSGAQRTVKGGTGSGDVNEREAVTIAQGMENAGFKVTTKSWLSDYETCYIQARQQWKQTIMDEAEEADPDRFFSIYASHPFQMPAGRAVANEDVKGADTDTAVFVISRIAGEAADRYEKPGDYYLTEEEAGNLEFVCGHFTHVVLVINTGSQIDLSFLETYGNIESVLYMVQAGMEGGNALADMLCGDVVPSGRLTDTWAYQYEDYPAAKTFSHNNGILDTEFYEEGIYVGYRYFDSFQVEPRYPFGFGLSYTEFSIEPAGEPVTVNEARQEISVRAVVRNIGSRYSGREVVQVYAGCPQGTLEKERRRLCGFVKTGLLKPGEEEQVTITFPAKALASFFEEKNAWMAEKGIYGIWAGSSSRNLALYGGISVPEDGVAEETGSICPQKRDLREIHPFGEAAAVFEEAWRRELEERKLPVRTLAVKREMLPVYGKPEAEVQAEALTEKLTRDELVHMVVGEISRGQSEAVNNSLGSAGMMVPGAAGETSSVLEEKYGVPGMPMADGPAGLRLAQTYEVSAKDGRIFPKGLLDALEGGFFAKPSVHPQAVTYYQYCTAIPVGTLLAQTWDVKLLKEVGRAIAEEMEEFGITWWLAPGMNIHRDPLCGRNFEYFSEDPLVSGLMAAALTQGVQEGKGVGTTIKHFACNNQEDNRLGSDSVVSQRTLREIYLRGFEIAVKTSQPMAIMTSYNLINGVHAANNYDLCTRLARKEWGFQGIIMTDWTTTSPYGGSIPHKCIKAGNDLIMPGSPHDLEEILQALDHGDLEMEDLKACAKRILTIACQSNCFEDSSSYGARFNGSKGR